MTQTTTGWRSVFSLPAVYGLAQSAIGGARVRRTFIDEYVQPHPGASVLDIGCGTGNLVPFLDDCDYVGFDPSERYIDAAREQFGDVAEFHVGSVGEEQAADERFDRAIAKGVLHHLDDQQAAGLFAEAHRALVPGGRLVTIDPCFVDGQSRIARALIGRDRGENVRTPEAYSHLAEASFAECELVVRHDLLRVPYSHAITVCVKTTGT